MRRCPRSVLLAAGWESEREKEGKRTSALVVRLSLNLRQSIALHLLRQPGDVLVTLLRVRLDRRDVLVVGVDGILRTRKASVSQRGGEEEDGERRWGGRKDEGKR